MTIDLSLRVLWSIANAEASLAAAETITPDFFWLAALKLLDRNLPSVVKELGIESDDTAQLVDGVNGIRLYLEISEHRATLLRRSLRRKLRQNLSTNPREEDIKMLHRSPESREVFYIASKIARQHGAKAVSAFHIVKALFDADYVTTADLGIDDISSNSKA